MKLFGKTKDGAIDELLRAYVSQPLETRRACSDFDPDLASAYVERSLPAASRARYEEHLYQCVGCRKGVVTLARIAAAEASPAGAPREAARGWLAGFRETLGSVRAPQWAIAAAAVIVLAVSLPLVLKPRVSDRAEEAVAGAAPGTIAREPAPAAPASELKSKENDSQASTLVAKRDKREGEAAGGKASLAANTQAPLAEDRAASEESKTLAKSAADSADQLQQKSQEQVSAAKPSSQPESQTGTQSKLESEGSRQQRKDAVQGDESKQARSDDDAGQRRAENRSQQIAPPPPASEPARGGSIKTRGRLSLRDSESESVRLVERKIAGRTFVLKAGTWTDKEFDPEKDLPVVTLIRDSNVYKEVVGKRAKLKACFTNFAPNERAIIVFKGTVYKLIPQQADK